MLKTVKFFFILPVLLVFLLLFLWHSCAQAEDKEVDVILLLDSSGSMKVNDPNKLRNEAAKLFLRLIGDNAGIGIISFDSYGRVLSPLKPFAPARDMRLLENIIDKVGYEGAFTNIYAGLKEALREMARNNRMGAKKSVIFFTDGQLELPPTWGESEEKVRQKVSSELLPDFKEKDIAIHSIAFTEQADQTLLQEVSYVTGGGYYKVLSPQDFQKLFLEIFNNIRQPESFPLINNRFRVDQNVEEISLFIPKEAPKEIIVLETPGKMRISKDKRHKDMKWHSEAGYELISIKNPDLGDWSVLFENKKEREGKLLLITNLKLETSLKENYFNQGDALSLSAWLTKDGERITDPSFLSTVTFKVIMTAPEPEGDYTMELFDDGSHDDSRPHDGIYANSFQATKTFGRYKVTFLTEGKTFSRQKGQDLWTKKKREETRPDTTSAIVSPSMLTSEKQVMPGVQTGPAVIDPKAEWSKMFRQFLFANLVLLPIVSTAYFFRKIMKRRNQKHL